MVVLQCRFLYYVASFQGEGYMLSSYEGFFFFGFVLFFSFLAVLVIIDVKKLGRFVLYCKQ